MCIFCEKAQNQLAGGLTPSQKREVEQCEVLRDRRVRATILTGFLGAGKTTFLNFVLKSLGHGKRLAVVQNEFGSIPIDDQLTQVEQSDTEVVVMPNGCLCCRVRGDLVEALRRLAEKHVGSTQESEVTESKLDGLLIECSGLSDVLPVAQTFFADPFVQASYQLDGVVCVCDAANFEVLEADEPEAAAGPAVGRLLREQLSISDVCLLNKCDLVSSVQRDRIGSRVRIINPAIKVVPCRHGKVNLSQVLKLNSFSLDNALSLDAHFLGEEEVADAGHGHEDTHGHGHGHSGDGRQRAHTHAGFGSLGLQVDDAIDLGALRNWLRHVVEQHGGSLVRIKGVLKVKGSAKRVIVQGVGGHIEINEEVSDAMSARASSTSVAVAASRLVLIGRLLDWDLREQLKAGFLSTAAGSETTPAES